MYIRNWQAVCHHGRWNPGLERHGRIGDLFFISPAAKDGVIYIGAEISEPAPTTL